MGPRVRASIEDLYRVPENAKAEVVNGELVLMSPTGSRPGRAATRIATSLSNHEDSIGGGHAFGDNVGFLVDLPDRDSFSPDAAWYVGEIESMEFYTERRHSLSRSEARRTMALQRKSH
jgi:Uma2 family endonuclease